MVVPYPLYFSLMIIKTIIQSKYLSQAKSTLKHTVKTLCLFLYSAQFWRFAITGCDNNSELKVWSCELWNCLQTIKFAPMPSTQKAPVLKARLDLAAGYLLLSDIYNKVLYILSITKDSDEAVACINTVSEFLLPYPILSFAIVDAGQRRLRPTSESLEDLCPCDDENEDQLVIRMYLVQPKSLQECHIAFRPPLQISGNCLMDTLTHDSLDYSEDLPDIGTVNHNGIVGVTDDDEGNDKSHSYNHSCIIFITSL